MSTGVFALLFGLGIGAWVFNKAQHRTNDNRASITIAAVVGLIAMFVFYTLFRLTFHK